MLVHPNTTEEDVHGLERELKNHTERAIWLGERIPLDVGRFKALVAAFKAQSAATGSTGRE